VRTFVFVALAGALFVYEAWVLFVHQTGVPVIAPGDRPRLAGEIAGRVVLTQSFTLEAAGLSAIVIEPHGPAEGSQEGDVVFLLVDLGNAVRPAADGAGVVEGREVARVVRPLAEVVASSRYRISFPPIADSAGKRYRLIIAAPALSPGRGLQVLATRDQTYAGGVLTVGDKEEWGDLVFRAEAEDATIFRRVQAALRHAPLWLGSPWVLGAIVLLYNWALAVFAWYMLVPPGARPEDAAVQGSAHVTS
jgi:hypothetical protein